MIDLPRCGISQGTTKEVQSLLTMVISCTGVVADCAGPILLRFQASAAASQC